ncbi:MAG: OmpA family protein [Bacteroidetes bacterium]|nr:OmpA family protein [Bacteroidota bacterium]MCL5739044.1 OmpA family protein [Bacteroidota bacterium]
MEKFFFATAVFLFAIAVSNFAYAQVESDSEESSESVKQPAATTPQEGLKAYSKFDFVPGENVIFFDDFSQDNVGDFPALWNTNASGEVVTLSEFPGKWFKMKPGGSFYPEMKGVMPENFTIEYDLVYSYKAEAPSFSMDIFSTIEGERIDELVAGNGGAELQLSAGQVSLFNWKDKEYGAIRSILDNEHLSAKNNQVVRVSIAVQKERVRVYLDQDKIYDIPKLLYPGLTYDRIRFYSGNESEGYTPYISNFRVAVGVPDMRSKLITEGKLVTRGILFNSGSDKIKPESYGTLKMISDILKENPSVKVKIVGHTDSDGDEKSNFDLSKRRAASVKNVLSNEFGVEMTRMEVDGKGESEPVSPNTTPEGKANNRRVEFIKL